MKFSVTKINTFLTCPRAYYFKYVLGMQQPPNDKLFFGNAIHEGIAAFYKKQNPIKAFRKVVATGQNKPPQFQTDKYVGEGEKVLEQYINKAPYFRPKIVEEFREINLTHPISGEAIPYPFIFKIDLITEDGYIVDHKTTSGTGKTQYETDRIQAIAYCMAYRGMFGVRPKAFIQNAITKHKVPRIVPTIYEYTPDDEAYIFDLFVEVLGMIERREYLTAQPMVKTFFPCKFKHICDIHRPH